MRKLIYFGTYEQNYPRNRMVIELLKEEYEVEELHEPLWEKSSDKTGSFLSLSNLIPFFFTAFKIYFGLFFKLKSKLKKDDIIVTGYIGQFDLYFLYFFRFFFKKYTIVANPLVSFYDTIVEDRKIVKKGSFIARQILKAETKMYAMCAQVWVDTKQNQDYFIKTFQLDSRKVKVVYVGAEDFFFENKDIHKFDKFTVLFYGKYIPLHGLDKLIETIPLMPKSTEWMFIGKGQLYDKIYKEFEALRKIGHKISIISWVDYENLNNFINGAHVLLGIFGDSDKAKRVIPNKLFQSVATKNVVLTSDSLAIREIFDEKSIFMCENSPDAIKKSLINIKDNYDDALKVAANGYEKFNKCASKLVIKKSIIGYISSLEIK